MASLGVYNGLHDQLQTIDRTTENHEKPMRNHAMNMKTLGDSRNIKKTHYLGY